MKHTPGPWRVSEKYPNLIVAIDPDTGATDQLASACQIMREWKANARLIAAAPDLLAAAKAVIKLDLSCGDLAEFDAAVDRLNALVREIEGGAP